MILGPGWQTPPPLCSRRCGGALQSPCSQRVWHLQGVPNLTCLRTQEWTFDRSQMPDFCDANDLDPEWFTIHGVMSNSNDPAKLAFVLRGCGDLLEKLRYETGGLSATSATT